MSEWQPIETAPRDRPILGFWQYVYPGDHSRTCGMRTIKWDHDRGGWLDEDGEAHTWSALEDEGLWTHWMPLPKPPDA